ncbi:hypothetical protein [Haloplasma contractile]|nr:hypothetical protein [Haloplasma contractile]
MKKKIWISLSILFLVGCTNMVETDNETYLYNTMYDATNHIYEDLSDIEIKLKTILETTETKESRYRELDELYATLIHYRSDLDTFKKQVENEDNEWLDNYIIELQELNELYIKDLDDLLLSYESKSDDEFMNESTESLERLINQLPYHTDEVEMYNARLEFSDQIIEQIEKNR